MQSLEQKSAIPPPAGAAAAGPAEGARPVSRLRRAGGLLANPRLRILIQIALVGVVFFFLGRYLWGLWPEIRAYPWHVEWGYVLLALLILIARGPIICMGWRLILIHLGYPLPWPTAIRIYFYSGLAKYM